MKLYPYSEFDGGEDAADDREAWLLAARKLLHAVAGEGGAAVDYAREPRGRVSLAGDSFNQSTIKACWRAGCLNWDDQNDTVTLTADGAKVIGR